MRQRAPVEREPRDGHRGQPIAFHIAEAEGARAKHQRHVFRGNHRVARGHRHVIDRRRRDIKCEFRGVSIVSSTKVDGGGRGNILSGGNGGGQCSIESPVSTAIRRDGRKTEIGLSLSVTGRILTGGNSVFIEFDPEGGTGRTVEGSIDSHLCGGIHIRRDQHREVLQVVGAGVSVARIVDGDAIGLEVNTKLTVVNDCVLRKTDACAGVGNGNARAAPTCDGVVAHCDA